MCRQPLSTWAFAVWSYLVCLTTSVWCFLLAIMFMLSWIAWTFFLKLCSSHDSALSWLSFPQYELHQNIVILPSKWSILYALHAEMMTLNFIANLLRANCALKCVFSCFLQEFPLLMQVVDVWVRYPFPWDHSWYLFIVHLSYVDYSFTWVNLSIFRTFHVQIARTLSEPPFSDLLGFLWKHSFLS